MMRRFFLFLMIFLISIISLGAAETEAHSTEVETNAQIKTKLTAGTAQGTFVGFSSTSYDTTSGGLTPITSLNLTLNHQTPTTEIDSLTASGSFHAYWIVRNNTSAMKIRLSWDVPEGIAITVSKDGTMIENPSDLVTVDASSSSTTGKPTVGSQLISIVTKNLLDKNYGATYTIVFTIKAEVVL